MRTKPYHKTKIPKHYEKVWNARGKLQRVIEWGTENDKILLRNLLRKLTRRSTLVKIRSESTGERISASVISNRSNLNAIFSFSLILQKMKSLWIRKRSHHRAKAMGSEYSESRTSVERRESRRLRGKRNGSSSRVLAIKALRKINPSLTSLEKGYFSSKFKFRIIFHYGTICTNFPILFNF